MQTDYKLQEWIFTTPGIGASKRRVRPQWSYDFCLTGQGSVSAVVQVKVRNVADGPWSNFGNPVSLSGMAEVSSTQYGDVPWFEHCIECVSISGTNARLCVVASAG